MTRFITSLVLSALLVGALAIPETVAQSEPGHVYTLRYHKVYPGKSAEYNAVYRDVVRPVLEKLKADGEIVSFLDLEETFGDQDATHIIIVEYENMAALDDGAAKLEAASQAVLGKPFQEATGDLTVLRKYTGTEIFGSTQPN